MLLDAKNQLVHAVLLVAVIALLALAAQGAFFFTTTHALSITPDAHALVVDTPDTHTIIACVPDPSQGNGGGC